MIRWPYLCRLLGLIALGLAVSQCIPLVIALIANDGGTLPLLKAVLLTAGIGGLLSYFFRSESHELSQREALLLVVLVWMTTGVLGGLPFYFSEHFLSFTDAVFECVSGFTTTGASILSSVEALPGSLLFWRAFTHWLGGLGIILLMVAILPLIGAGGMALYQAEFSGAKSEKLKPRLAETVVAFWKIYVAYTVAGFIALRLAGMNSLDASSHTFAALATGGFSNRSISIEAFHSPIIEAILIILMVAGGLSFTQHYRLLVRRTSRVFKDTETWFYLGLLTLATLVLTLNLHKTLSLGILEAARQAAFQVVSIMTATGFSSANFGIWSFFAQFLLLSLMFAGGCTGSTAGGLKSARVVLLLRVVGHQFRTIVHPREVHLIRFNRKTIDEKTIQALLSMVYLAILVNITSSLLLVMTGVDIVTAISGVTACMFNVGPGLGEVGPYSNYGHLHPFAKWVLTFTMIAGRLEFYTFLIIFTPFFWRK